jgi:hypothetical protein
MKESLAKLKELDPETYNVYMYANDHPELEGEIDQDWLQGCIQRAIVKCGWDVALHYVNRFYVKWTAFVVTPKGKFIGGGSSPVEAILIGYLDALGEII